MLGNILPPYHSLQELNLDWILTKVKDMLRFLPDDGSVGQILRRTAHGAEWSNEQGGGAVNSVNGQTGDVVLTAADVGALADTTPIPTAVSDLNNDLGFVDAAGAAAAAPVQSVNGQTGAVTITAPVTSVNGQTGAVSLSIPTKTSELNNDSGFVDSAGAAAAAPVQSVNGQTGAVVLNSYATGTISYARTLGSGTLDQSMCFKVGNVANIGVRVYGINEAAAGDWFVLPAGFIPAHDCCISGTLDVSGTWYPLNARISAATGRIAVNWSTGQQASQVQVYGTYILD